jgi:hypothetical protein
MSVRLYAVLRLRPRAKPALPAGLRGERLRILKCPGFSIAVAGVRAALETTPDNLLAFDRVIRLLAARSDAILPARFGAVAGDVTTLKAEIADRAGALAAALDQVAGRVQMTLRLPASPPGGVVSRQPSRQRGRISRAGPGSKYLQTRAAAAHTPAVTKLRKALSNLVRAERIEAAPGSTTVYHMIDSSDVAAYRARVMGCRVSGPFPPYAFVPGIDHAISPGHDDENNEFAGTGSKASRRTRQGARRRSAGNANR